MFRIDQIITATTFIRSFRAIADHLAQHPEPLLITQKNGRFIVVMDGEFFEGLLDARRQLGAAGNPTQRQAPYDLKSD